MICQRCGQDRALSEADLASIHAKVGPEDFPPIPAGICVRCLLEDPVLRAELRPFADAKIAKMEKSLREALARPLEIIDELVERFR